MILKALSNYFHFFTFVADCGRLDPKNIGRLFEESEKNNPAFVILENIDTLSIESVNSLND